MDSGGQSRTKGGTLGAPGTSTAGRPRTARSAAVTTAVRSLFDATGVRRGRARQIRDHTPRFADVADGLLDAARDSP